METHLEPRSGDEDNIKLKTFESEQVQKEAFSELPFSGSAAAINPLPGEDKAGDEPLTQTSSGRLISYFVPLKAHRSFLNKMVLSVPSLSQVKYVTPALGIQRPLLCAHVHRIHLIFPAVTPSIISSVHRPQPLDPNPWRKRFSFQQFDVLL